MNGWMNERLRLEWESASTHQDFDNTTNPDAGVWLNYSTDDGINWYANNPPVAAITDIESNPASYDESENSVTFSIKTISNPFQVPLTKIIWSVNGVGYESDIAANGLPAEITVNPNIMPVSNVLEIEAFLAADLSGTVLDVSNALIDSFTKTFTPLNAAPVTSLVWKLCD